MHKSVWLFVSFFMIHLVAILFHKEEIAIATKPALLASLMLFYAAETKRNSYSVNIFIAAALLFSFFGDVLLMFQAEKPVFFIFGLIAFLTAHVFYILYFASLLKKQGGLKIKWPAVFLTACYAAGLVILLFPRLGGLKIPVMIYATVISVMLLSVIHAFKNFTAISAKLCLAGAVLFVLSDSLLAFNKFHTAFAAAPFLIMLSYGLAQLCLVLGILNIKNTAA